MATRRSSIIDTIQIPEVLLAVVVMFLATVLLFFDLGKPSIFIWDEAIYANNALDMHDFGDLIVLQRKGEYTLYNTKPPMGIWMQSLSIACFGPSEFAVRFPSALAAWMTCLMLLVYSYKSDRDLRIGILAVMILVSSHGYVRQHVTRSGDLDSMLVFWTTFYSLVVVYFLINRTTNYRKTVVFAALGMTAAFYTKSVAGFLPLAGLMLSSLVSGKARFILTRRSTYIAGVATLAACGAYYVLRELILPGYLGHTAYSEYSRFYKNIMPWHTQPFYYYPYNWIRFGFFLPFFWILPVAIIGGLIRQKYRLRTTLYLAWIAGFLLIISIPPNKLLWYDAPVYPLLALLCATGIVAFVDYSKRYLKDKSQWLFVIVLLIGLVPAHGVFTRNVSVSRPVDPLEREGYTIRQLREVMPELKQYTVFMPVKSRPHWTQADFYMNAYNRHFGYSLGLKDSMGRLRPGETVLCCQENSIDSIESGFEVKMKFQNDEGCVLMELLSSNTPEPAR